MIAVRRDVTEHCAITSSKFILHYDENGNNRTASWEWNGTYYRCAKEGVIDAMFTLLLQTLVQPISIIVNGMSFQEGEVRQFEVESWMAV